jgi:gas vesicle protein
MSRDSGTGDFLAGFFVGAMVGAAFAMLFTPTSGEEIREQIKEKGVELKNRAEELGVDPSRLGELKDKGQAMLQEQRHRIQDAVEEGKSAAERRKEELLSQFQPPAHTQNAGPDEA